MIHPSTHPLGRGAYLAAMTSVFAHPGRRFGQLVETLFLAFFGALLGTAWSILGVYLGSLVETTNPSAMFAIRAVFLVLAFLVHGFLRSQTPRLFTFVLLEVILCMTGLTTNSHRVTHDFATGLIYPVLVAAIVIFVINLCIFPEFSSGFLGKIAIETLRDVSTALAEAGASFVAPERKMPLNTLTTSKPSLRANLAKLEAAQNETQSELAFSVLPPRDLKEVSKRAMKRLVANTIAVIGACESRYLLLKDSTEDLQAQLSSSESSIGEPDDSSSPTEKSRRMLRYDSDLSDGIPLIDLSLDRATRGIEYGDADVLCRLMERITEPYQNLQKACDATVKALMSSLSLCYVSIHHRSHQNQL